MPLGTDVGLSAGDFVLVGDPAPHSQRGGGARSPQIFGPCLLWPNGWMHQDMPLGMEVGLSPGDFVFDGDPATPRKKAYPLPPNFWPMSIVAKRLDR